MGIININLLLFICVIFNCAERGVSETGLKDFDDDALNLFPSLLKGITTIVKQIPTFFQELPFIPKRITNGIMNKMLSPENVMNFGLQSLIGLPQATILSAIDYICGAANYIGAIKPKYTPNINEMNYVLMTKNSNIPISLKKSSKLWRHPGFDNKLKVIILVTGWNSNLKSGDNDDSSKTLNTIYNAYRCRDDYNFVVIDTANFITSLYEWSAINTELIGHKIGYSLAHLTKFVPIENIHLIGHSLGAHICGIAGKTFTNITTLTLPRITGLDPARPCFSSDIRINGLERGDADFVDVIHTNVGAFGIRTQIGDVDFFPNGYNILQPGCLTIACSHNRAFEYYAESVYPGNEYAFMTSRCISYDAYKKNDCAQLKIPMGIATPTSARGSHFITTNGRQPYSSYSRNINEYTQC